MWKSGLWSFSASVLVATSLHGQVQVVVAEESACFGPPLDYSRVESLSPSNFESYASSFRDTRSFQVDQVLRVAVPAGDSSRASCAQRFRLKEKQNGVPIFGAQILATLPGCQEDGERMRPVLESNGLSGQSYLDLTGKTFSNVAVQEGYEPAVTPEQVEKFLRQEYPIPQDKHIEPPELYIYPTADKDYLAYSTRILVVNAEEQTPTYVLHVFVDAHKLAIVNSCVITSAPDIRHSRRRLGRQPSDGDERRLDHLPGCETCTHFQAFSFVSLETTTQQIKSLYLNDTGKMAVVQEATVQDDGSTVYIPARVEDLFWEGTYDCGDTESCSRVELPTTCPDAMSDIQYVAVETLKFTQNQLLVLGGLSVSADDPQWVRGYAHYGGYYSCNAFYYLNEVAFTDCDCVEWTPLTSPDVVAHELAHGLTRYSSDLYYYDQSGGLNEGFSDILGAVMEFVINDSKDRPDFDVGEMLLGSRGTLRYMEDPPLDGVSIGSVCSWSYGMGVHFSSGVLNKAFVKSVRACQAHSCTRTLQECALLMGKLFFYTNLSQLTSLSTFLDAAEKTCSVVDEFFTQINPITLCTTDQVKSFVIEGWNAVNVVIDDTDCTAANDCVGYTPPPTAAPPSPSDYSDGCLNATIVSVPSTVIATTEGATSYNLQTCYGATSHNSGSPGLWYQIVGDGEPVEASMCSSGSNGDSVMQIWTGDDCSALECVTSNDNYCGLFSRVVFRTNVGQTYYIFIYGSYGSTYPFELTLTQTTPQPTMAPTPGPLDLEAGCLEATPLALPSTTYDTTIEADKFEAQSCGSAYAYTSRGRWYAVNGTGSEITASLCDFTDFDTLLSVWTGSCSGLACVGGDDYGCLYWYWRSTVTWRSTYGQTYYIFVYGDYGSEGSFELSLYEETPAPSSAPTNTPFDPELGCLVATPKSVPSTTFGTTTGADVYAATSCGSAYSYSSAGLWYTVSGTGYQMTASLCNYADFDTQISVWTGSCSGLECVGGNNDYGCYSSHDTYLKSSVTWYSTSGQTYYIFVYGNYGATGSFELFLSSTVTSPPPTYSSTWVETYVPTWPETYVPTSTVACSASDIPIGSTVSDTTIGTPVLYSESCGGASSINSAGIWYKVTGDGSTITASLCNDGTNFDTLLSVWTGDCSSLLCVAGNDDACSSLRSSVTFQTTSDQTYFIFVHGYGGETGSFELEISAATAQGRLRFGPDELETDSDIKTLKINSQLTFSFSEGKGAKPSEDEIEILSTDSVVFFKDQFLASDTFSAVFSGLKITDKLPDYDPSPGKSDMFVLKFVTEIGVKEKAQVMPREAAEIMANAPYADYIDSYVRKVGGAFAETTAVHFKGIGNNSFS